jgi:hypothetical protein
MLSIISIVSLFSRRTVLFTTYFNTISKQLVLQAKKVYEAEAAYCIQIYFANSRMSSIVLNPGVIC